jgi:hypothetical protein
MGENHDVGADNDGLNRYSRYRGGEVVQIRLERNLTRALVELAALERRSITSLCNCIIEEFLRPRPERKCEGSQRPTESVRFRGS